MNQVIQREAATVGLQVRQRRNRELLAELLAEYDLVDIEDSVPEPADLCIVDEGGFERCKSALADWKTEQSPTFAPVLLLASPDRKDPWSRYADRLGDSVDAVMQVPMPRRAILARAKSLLETRRFAIELAGERELNRRIFDTSPVGKTVLDTDGVIIQANQRAQDVLGLETSALEGRAYDDPEWNLTAPDGEPLSPEERPFNQVTRTGEPVNNQEIAFERPDGETVQLAVNMAPVVDERGEIEYLVAAMDDVTEERRLERELRASEELHRTTLEHIHDTVVITDDEGRFTYVCPNSQNIFGLTTEEVEALGDVKTLLGADPAPDDLQAEGVVENVELEIVDADGDEHIVLVTVKAVSIQHGSRLYTVRDITERAATEQTLHETVQSRSLALEAANAGVWQWDPRTDEFVPDESLLRLADLDDLSPDRIQEAFSRGIHPDDFGDLEAALEGAVESRRPFQVPFRFTTVAGQTRWYENRGRAMTDEDGTVDRVLGVAIDVTERVRRVRALERYERIVETAPDPIYALDSEGVLTLANEAFGALFGVDGDELLGTDITSLLSPANVEASLTHIDELAADADPDPLELTIETVEGPREYEVNIALHGETEEQPPGTVGVAHDVTERRERERLLRRAQRAVEASGHAIYITDPDGTIVYANPAFERVTGYSPTEAIGRTPSILRSDVTGDDHYEALWRTVSAGEVWDEEIVNRRKDGERYHADQTIAPIKDEDGEIEGYVAIQTDVTEHKDRLQQLQVMDRVLRHNLHNALNVVLGHADMILEATTGQPSADAATILRKGEELLDLVDKQRSITKTLSAEPSVEPVDLVALVELVADDLREEHPEAQIELSLPASAVCRADGDIEKAVRELVTNAIEHADQPSPTVRLVVEPADEAVGLQVIDEGPGISEMDREVVTGEKRIEPLYHGSGLGLWLVAWIVRRSGGTLGFEENEPRGSVVTMRLEPAQETS